jgi:hypothetical protein
MNLGTGAKLHQSSSRFEQVRTVSRSQKTIGELIRPPRVRGRRALRGGRGNTDLPKLSRKFDLSAYDANCLALAPELRSPTACNDGPLRSVLSRAGVKPA